MIQLRVMNFVLLTLIGLGKNKNAFSTSIRLLASWLGDRNYPTHPLRIKIEMNISDDFRNSLFVTEFADLSDRIIVLREFIRSGILGLYLQLQFSNALINLDNSLSIRNVLKAVYSNKNLITDIETHVEELFQDAETQEDTFLGYRLPAWISSKIPVTLFMDPIKRVTGKIFNSFFYSLLWRAFRGSSSSSLSGSSVTSVMMKF